MPLTGLDRFTDTKCRCRGGPPCPPAQDGVVVLNVICVADSKLSACAVDASRSCRSRRYSLTPLTMVITLSAPGPLVQHSTALRVFRFFCVDNRTAWQMQNLRVGADRRVRPHRMALLLWMSFVWRRFHNLRLRGGCLTFVPKSPVSTDTTNIGDYTFGSRPSRSTFHHATRFQVFLCR
jgi:hypothetical protein